MQGSPTPGLLPSTGPWAVGKQPAQAASEHASEAPFAQVVGTHMKPSRLPPPGPHCRCQSTEPERLGGCYSNGHIHVVFLVFFPTYNCTAGGLPSTY